MKIGRQERVFLGERRQEKERKNWKSVERKLMGAERRRPFGRKMPTHLSSLLVLVFGLNYPVFRSTTADLSLSLNAIFFIYQAAGVVLGCLWITLLYPVSSTSTLVSSSLEVGRSAEHSAKLSSLGRPSFLPANVVDDVTEAT